MKNEDGAMRLMMYWLRQNDEDRCAINDAMFALMCRQAHIISKATSLP